MLRASAQGQTGDQPLRVVATLKRVSLRIMIMNEIECELYHRFGT